MGEKKKERKRTKKIKGGPDTFFCYKHKAWHIRECNGFLARKEERGEISRTSETKAGKSSPAANVYLLP